jgi:hypothetical protein
VKPYNPKKGYKVKRTKVLGKLWIGGEGILPDDIPEWAGVNRAQAEILATFHQTDGDLSTPKLFDIVTDEQRQLIDQREMEQRMMALRIAPTGLGSVTLDRVKGRYSDVTSGVEKALQPHIGKMTLADLVDTKQKATQANNPDFLTEIPPQAAGAYLPEESDVTGRNVTGRTEALTGFDEEKEAPPAKTYDDKGYPHMPTARKAVLPPIKAKAPNGASGGKTTKRPARKKSTKKAKK